MEVRHFTGVESGLDRIGEFGLTGAVMGERQQANRGTDYAGWVGLNGGGPFFESIPRVDPGPVTQDPAHPFVPNGVGKQPTYRIADLTNPNLKPWAKEHMKKENDEVLAGKVAFTRAQAACL
jgi:hypothetical protein